MKVTTSAILLGAALGVSARPSAHAHQKAHEKRDFFVAEKPATTSTAAAAATTTSAAAAATTTASSSSGAYIDFCSTSSSSKKRATAEEIAYVGNTGTSDDYGCNIMSVTSDIVDLYNYTITFTNDVDESQTCKCWNKIGSDGGIDGFFEGYEALNFTLPASGKSYVAIEADSQGGCACYPGDYLPVTLYGEFASTWVEFDFADTANSEWSGADASCLVAYDANSAATSSLGCYDSSGTAVACEIPALKVCSDASSTCSTITAGGSGTNAYTGGTNDEDGVGLDITPGALALKVTVGTY